MRSEQQHRFGDDLARSITDASASWWLPFYRAAFPATASLRFAGRDEQRRGYDRVLLSTHGVEIARVEEKVRERVWDDFVLEYWSDFDRRTRGWIAKDAEADWFAYFWKPSMRGFLIPFRSLRCAWRQHAREWVQKYDRVEARNERWLTVSVAVPVPVVLAAVSHAVLVERASSGAWLRLAA